MIGTQKAGVSVYRPYIPDTAIHSREGDTPSDTVPDTLSLKTLAFKCLANQKAIRPAIQKVIHPPKKRIGADKGGDTLLEAKNASSAGTIRRAYSPDCWTKATHIHRAVAYWHSVCPRYWRGCLTCPDAELSRGRSLNSHFCRRHPMPEWEAAE
jgi:hypothetical protein